MEAMVLNEEKKDNYRNKNKSKNRRSLRKSKNKNKQFEKQVKLVGVNSAGIISKLDSFDYILNKIEPTVFFLQETKSRSHGKIKTENSLNYQIFELLRKDSAGGGLAIGAVHDVEPVWISEGDNEVEILVIQIKIEDIFVRCVVGYGPQENDSKEKKLKFWSRLSKEVKDAQEMENAFILQMDGNLWAGKDIIPGDNHVCNQNGKMFRNFLQNHPHLTVVNSLELCEGLITRRRKTTTRLEEAVLDFFVCCDKIKPFLSKMTIDEDRKFSLSRYRKVKGNMIKTDSDHHTEILELNISYIKKKSERMEVFNFKNKKCQDIFFNICEKSSNLSNCFKSDKSIEKQTNVWFKNLQNMFQKSFKKIRIKSKVINTEISQLLDGRKNIFKT